VLKFITKSDVWCWRDAGIPSPKRGNVKDYQDIFVLSWLGKLSKKHVLEIGGGDSRVLRELSKQNECWNAEKFTGQDGGPAKRVEIPGVRIAEAFLGEFSDALPTSRFDVVFSISVLEHVPTANLADLFKDCARVLKPGGRMLHAIDMYLLTPAYSNNRQVIQNTVRLEAYLHGAKEAGFVLDGPNEVAVPTYFDSAMVSNTDDAMENWNKIAPKLKPLRAVAQGVSLMGAWRKG